MIAFCARPILSTFSPCFSPLRAGGTGRELSEEMREGRKPRKMKKGRLYVYDSLDYLCKLKNVVHDIPLASAVACLTVALLSFPKKYTPPRQALCGA